MYLQKKTITITAASSGDYGIQASTVFNPGFLQCVEYLADGTNPLNANSSGVLLLRIGSTTGKVVFRSSSGLAGTNKYYYPRVKVHNSTSGAVLGTSSLPGMVPVADDLLYMCRNASSTGSTMGAQLKVYVGG